MRGIGVSCLVGMAGLATLACCGPAYDMSMRGVVRDITYGKDEVIPPTDYELRVYALLKPILDRPYLDCGVMAKLVAQQSGEDLHQAGKRIGTGKAPSEWAKTANDLFPQHRGSSPVDPLIPLALGEASVALTSFIDTVARRDDGTGQVHRAADVVLRRIREHLEEPEACSRVSPQKGTTTLALGGGSANGAYTAGILFEIFSLRERLAFAMAHPDKEPLFEGQTKASLRQSRLELLESSKFTAAAGTSVGALLAQLADLYFTELEGADEEEERVGYCEVDSVKAGKWSEMRTAFCTLSNDKLRVVTQKNYGVKPPKYSTLILSATELEGLARQRLPQAWALGLMQEYFTDIAEPEAICVQPGSAMRLVGFLGKKHPGLMRFDPLEAGAIRPFLDVASKELLDNTFRRIVHAVEVHQNLEIGLDERACRGVKGELGVEDEEALNQLRKMDPELRLPKLQEKLSAKEYEEALKLVELKLEADKLAPARCLSAGVMASVVQPLFAQPVNRVRSGLSENEDCGIWLDAGVRSGLPALQALRRSRPVCHSVDSYRTRVLALSTARAGGIPSKSPDDAISVGLEAIGEMGHQIQKSEVALTAVVAEVEQERFEALGALLGDETCGSSGTTPSLEIAAGAGGGTSTEPPASAGGTSGVGGGDAANSLATGGVVATLSEAAPGSEREHERASGVSGFQQTCTHDAHANQLSGLTGHSSPHFEILFVPEDVPPHLVASAGYRFDPYVMRGLFAFGRSEAASRLGAGTGLHSKEARWYRSLGWKLDKKGEEILQQLLDDDLRKMQKWTRFFKDECRSEAEERREAGKRRFDSKGVRSCCEAPGLRQAPNFTNAGCGKDSPKESRQEVPQYFGGEGASCR